MERGSQHPPQLTASTNTMKTSSPLTQDSRPAPNPAGQHRPRSSLPHQGWLRRVCGAVLLFVGFLLSPLSWWNDLLVNVPLALAFARVVSLLYPPLFGPAFFVGYVATNVLGFLLMHLGARIALTDPWLTACLRRLRIKALPKPRLLREVGFALLYTTVVMAMMHLGFVKPIGAYLNPKGSGQPVSLSSILPAR